MRTIILSTNGFSIPEDMPKFHVYRFLNPYSDVYAYLEPLIGLITAEQLATKPVFIFNEDKNSDNELEVLNKRIATINSFLSMSCWILKDSCASIPFGYLLNSQIEGPFWDNQKNYCTLANGSHENSVFSMDEFQNVWDLNKKLIDMIGKLESVYKSENGFVSSTFSLRNYSTFNKMARAQQFIFNARNTSSLLQKISWYIVALEALFSNGSSDISFKLKLMTAYFIGGTPEELDKIATTINNGYDLRSKYLHGASFDTKSTKKLADHGYQAEVSVGLDSILRTVFNIILEDDTKKEIVLNEEKSNSFFKQKILGYS